MSNPGKLVTINGVTKSTTIWAQQIGISRGAFINRINKWGINAEEILLVGKRQGRSPFKIDHCKNGGRKNIIIEINGVSKSLYEWAQQIGITREGMRQRVHRWGINAGEILLRNVKMGCSPFKIKKGIIQ